MRRKQLVGSGMLLLAALIWGCAFVAQSVAMEHIGPFCFGAMRFAIGGITLLPVMAVSAAARVRRGETIAPSRRCRDLWVGGVLCGGLLFFASSAQQLGLLYTSVGKSGFITALYIVLVPIGGLLVFRRRLSPLLTVSIAAAVGGLYLLCMQGGLSLNRGDVYTFVCAILYTGHILAVDAFAPKTDGVQLSCLQFFVSALLNGAVALLCEPTVSWEMVKAAWLPLLYTGVMSSGVAYTFQILGQKRTSPAVASLLMSTESVFAALAGAVLLEQWLSLRELAGCCFMLVAVLVAQIPALVSSTKKASPDKGSLA